MYAASPTPVITASQPRIRFEFYPSQGTFDLVTRDGQNLVQRANMAIQWRQDGKLRNERLQNWRPGSGIETLKTNSGETFTSRTSGGELEFTLQIGPGDAESLVTWRLGLQNTGKQSVQIERIILLQAGQSVGGILSMAAGKLIAKLSFYSNGWQSWSFTGAYPADRKAVRSRLGMMQEPMVIYAGTPQQDQLGAFSSDFFGVINDLENRRGLVLGFLSQREHFGSLQVKLNLDREAVLWANGDQAVLQPGACMATDWAAVDWVDLDETEPLSRYLGRVAEENGARIPKHAPVGWCSWYQFYTKISDEIIRRNLEAVKASEKRLPLDLVQVDDGYETEVGDWLSMKPEFPQGVKPLAELIRESGRTPGLWFAPFIVNPRSKLYHQHPDWLLRNSKGRPVNAGFCWNALDTGLDLTVPAALDYCQDVIRTAVADWGYSFLKLDFLYAAALPGVYHNPTRTRAQVLYQGIKALREAMGDETFFLGCGMPLGSGIGLVDSNRIGPDVSGDWYPRLYGISKPFVEEPSVPCARNSIRNILTRAMLHRKWWINDPDCLLVRPDTHLSLEEVQTLTTVIGLTGGSLLVSDDLPALDEKRKRMAEILLPVCDKSARVLDWAEQSQPSLLRMDLEGADGPWSVVAWINWGDEPAKVRLTRQQFGLAEGDYWVSSFWDQNIQLRTASETLWETIAAPHSSIVLSVRAKKGVSQYLGSDLHLTQGMELASWKWDSHTIEATFDLPRQFDGNISIALPGVPVQVLVNDAQEDFEHYGKHIYRIQIRGDQKATVSIRV